MSSLNFLHAEKLYFKNPAWHRDKEGTLYVTEKRVHWSPFDQSVEHFEWPWTTIDKAVFEKSTPTAVGVQFKRATSAAVFKLISAPGVGGCPRELENLKFIYNSLKSGSAEAIPVIGVESLSDRISKPLFIDRETRTRLLEKDSFLKLQYVELVRTSRVVAEEDFWALYGPAADISLKNPGNQLAEGTPTNFLAESIKITERDLGDIPNCITESRKASIFLLYPKIKHAYQHRDSYISDEDFWRRYYSSFRPDSQEIDDLFLGAENDEIRSEMRKIKEKIVPKDLSNVRPDVNLVEMNDDLRIKSCKSDTDYLYQSKPLSNKRIALSLLTEGENEYNRQSKLVLQGSNGNQPGASRSVPSLQQSQSSIIDPTPTAATISTELLVHSDPYLNLNLSKILYKNKAKDFELMAAQRAQSNDLVSDDQVFRKSSTAINRKKQIQPIALMHPTELLASLESVLPSGNRGLQVINSFGAALTSLNAPALPVTKAQREAENASTSSSSEVIDLSEGFRQSMREMFFKVSGRMKLFYTLLDRDDFANVSKVEPIVNDLTKYSESLMAKKRQISALDREIVPGVDAALWMIDDLNGLIRMTRFRWEKFLQMQPGIV